MLTNLQGRAWPWLNLCTCIQFGFVWFVFRKIYLFAIRLLYCIQWGQIKLIQKYIIYIYSNTGTCTVPWQDYILKTYASGYLQILLMWFILKYSHCTFSIEKPCTVLDIGYTENIDMKLNQLQDNTQYRIFCTFL